MQTDEQIAQSLIERPQQEEPSAETEKPEVAEAEEPEITEESAEPETPEDTEVEEEPEVSEEPPRYRVKVDGEEREVTLEELTRGYSGNEYVQKGMREAAAMRKEAEQVFTALRDAEQRVVALEANLKETGLVRPPVPPNVELLNSDPIAYFKEQARFQQEQADFQKQQAEIASVREQQERARQSAMNAYLQEQVNEAIRAIPELGNPDTAKAVQAKLQKAGFDYGYTQQELDSVMDARALRVLHDAMKWQELQAAKTAARKNPEAAPKSLAPQARRPEPPQLAKAKVKQKALKSQKDMDWAAYLRTPQE